MKLASFVRPGAPEDEQRFGAVVPGGIVDLKNLLPYPTLLAMIAGNGLEFAQCALQGVAADYELSAVKWLPPIPNPEKIWCIGVNYPDRNAEYKDGQQPARFPSLFSRNPRSVVGHNVPIERPLISEQLDYEGEIVLVIGRLSKKLTRENALQAVFGLTLCNEGTIRDWLHHGKFNVTQGKNFDRSGSIGPWIRSADTMNFMAPLHLTTFVNGELRQSDTTDRLLFSFVDLLVYISSFATLCPGDLIVTGTPIGAGARRDPPIWLKPGDRVEISVPEIGTLSNVVIDAGDYN